MQYFSMFTGVGGFELGIERASNNRRLLQEQTNESLQRKSKSEEGQTRLTCIGFSEIDKYANQLLAKRFPDILNWGDCTKINASELPDFDMLCGGFPCQSFSIAGKRRGFQDTRGTMFFHIARILEVKRPKIVWLENVKGLLNHDKGETFKVIIQTLSELGYDVQWMVLNSKFHGVPQNRERVFIIGSLRGTSRPEVLPFTTDDRQLVEKDLEKTYNSGTITARYWKMEQSDQYIRYARKDRSQHSRVYNSEGIAPTLAGASKLSGDCTPKIIASRGRNPNNPSDRTTGSPTEQRLEINQEGTSNNLTSVQKDNLVLENTRIRRLTNIECERLQGFPDNWTEGFSGTQRYKMMGNAVTVNVIEAIASKMFAKVEDQNTTQNAITKEMQKDYK